jgi:hypothetical protein
MIYAAVRGVIGCIEPRQSASHAWSWPASDNIGCYIALGASINGTRNGPRVESALSVVVVVVVVVVPGLQCLVRATALRRPNNGNCEKLGICTCQHVLSVRPCTAWQMHVLATSTCASDSLEH